MADDPKVIDTEKQAEVVSTAVSWAKHTDAQIGRALKAKEKQSQSGSGRFLQGSGASVEAIQGCQKQIQALESTCNALQAELTTGDTLSQGSSLTEH